MKVRKITLNIKAITAVTIISICIVVSSKIDTKPNEILSLDGYWVSESDEKKYSIAADMKYLQILKEKMKIDIRLYLGAESTNFQNALINCDNVNRCNVYLKGEQKPIFIFELVSNSRLKIKNPPKVIIPGWQPGTTKRYISFAENNEYFRKIDKEDFPYPE